MAGPFDTTNPLFRPFLTPPAAAPALGTNLGMASAVPAISASIAPQVKRAPRASELAQQNYNDVVAKPAGVDTVHNPLIKGIARAGDIAASVFAPRIAQFIPGTTLNHERQVGIAAQRAKEAGAEDKTQTEIAESEAGTQQKKAMADYTAQRPDIEMAKLDQKQKAIMQRLSGTVAHAGQKIVGEDENGIPIIQDDTESSVYQSRKIHDDVEKSKKDLQDAEAELKAASNDPNSPAYKLAIDKAQTARANAGAAGLRAQAYYGNYLQGAFNTDLHGQVLPGAPQITGEGGGAPVTVGTKNASQAVKAQANVAQFKDVHGAIDHLEGAADELVKSGGRLNSPAVAAALAMPHATTMQWVQSLDKANLSPQERNYVQSVISAHENVQALRKSAGGTATDTSVARLEAMMPNASTPDVAYLKGQLKQVRETATRLGVGVTTVKGGLQNPNEAPKVGGGPQRFTVNGKTYNIPADQVSDFKKEFPNAK